MYTQDSKTYSYEEAKQLCLKYFRGDEIATDAYLNKYALKKDGDKNLIYEPTPDYMHRRLAKEFARIEKKYPNGLSEMDIYSLLEHFKYIVPQGGSMAGIGNPMPVSLSNCFVIGTKEDSYGAICQTDEEQVQISKRRGGVGHDLSYLRPAGTIVHNAAGTSSGMVSFMERYSHSIREVCQEGRRGALMLSCSITHPQVEDFIDAKLDTGKVTGANISVKLTDKFMNAVKEHKSFEQKFPIDSDAPSVSRKIDATAIWKKIMYNAWKSAEPGVLFWDTILKESTARLYGDKYEEFSTNPCLTGDTQVMVADGRGYVPLKTLVDEGKDVPVFCLSDRGNLVVKTMRNPRLTGKDKKILKITLENGHVIRCTENHKLLTTNGHYVEAINLVPGMSLQMITKSRYTFDELLGYQMNSKSNLYYGLGINDKLVFEHRLIAEHFYGYDKEHRVTHHIDGNSLNNDYHNLAVLTKKEHDAIHAKERQGTGNPIYKIKANPERFAEYRAKMSDSTSGEKNGMFREDITLEVLKAAGIALCKELNRGFSIKEYIAYTKRTLNFTHSNLKHNQLFDPDFESFVRCCIEESGIENTYWYKDSRILRTYSDAISQGYETIISRNGIVLVKKICEICGNEFWCPYHFRERAVCSHYCGILMTAKRNKENPLFGDKIRGNAKRLAQKNKNCQLQVYTVLKYELGREPEFHEWVEKCKFIGCPWRLGTKFGFRNYNEVVHFGNLYNHRIVSIEEDGYEDVYNGTVDEYHNFIIGGFYEIINDREYEIGFVNKQCGEIPLCQYGACVLNCINLYSYVRNPFTSEAFFDLELFKQHVKCAMHLTDDIIDLEQEKVQQIIDKIMSDPEKETTKFTELNLWKKIYDMHTDMRRVGLGITGLGDMLAALNYTYGTKEATEFAASIQQTLAVAAYSTSIELAKERGAFKIWNYETEKDAPFVNRVLAFMSSQTKREYARYGRRNVHCLTIAPTGTVSLMTQTTSGIECVFMPFYVRRRKVEASEPYDFVDKVGDHFQEYVVVHPKLVEWYIATQEPGMDYESAIEKLSKFSSTEMQALVDKSPYYHATTRDVDWVEKVRMQGEMQKFVDHSISVTVNLPESATEELVSTVYMTAWESGCKGCTIYREGSRDAVLINKEDKKSKKTNLLSSGHMSKRKPVLPAIVDVIKSRGETFAVLIGIDEGRPYEVFAFKIQPDEVPVFKANKQTTITKVAKKHYSLGHEFDHVWGAENILCREGSEEEQAITRMVSTMLRGGRIPLEEIIDQIIKSSTSIEKFSKALAICLQKFLKDGLVLHEKCPNCGGDMISYEGCKKCVNCGQSKCG